MERDVHMDSIVQTYKNNNESIKKTAKELGMSEQKCRRLLINSGAYSTKLSALINEKYLGGKTVKDIALDFKISENAVNSYLIYLRGEYTLDSKTTAWRKKKGN